MNHHGHIVKSLLKTRDMSQDQFANKLGITRAYLAGTLLEKVKWNDEYIRNAEGILDFTFSEYEQKSDPIQEIKIVYDKLISSKDETITILREQCNVLQKALLK